MGNAIPGKHCEKCMFHAFAFSKTCPRCGTAFPELVPPDAVIPA
jgi:rRNA maturation protein Nop10